MIPAPTLRVGVAPTRVNNENLAPLRVTNTTAPSVIEPINQEPPLNGLPQRIPSQHCYPTQNKIQARHVTTVTTDNAELPLSECPKTIITTIEDHHIFHYQKTYLLTIIPCMNHVICENTGKILE